MVSEVRCIGQDGCYWDGNCSGAPLESSCEEIAAALCEFTPGCFLVPQ